MKGLVTIPIGRASRVPLASDWQRLKTPKESEEAWRVAQERWPGKMGKAICTGPSGLLVLDLDVGHADGCNGLKSLAGHIGREMLKEWVSGAGVVCQTRRGGLHLYWLRPEGLGGTIKGLLPGVDTRGEGGLIICAPTPGYRWLSADWAGLTAPPEWLLVKLLEKESRSRESGRGTGEQLRVDCPICGEERAAVITPREGASVQGWGYCNACGRRWRASSKQVAWAMENQVR